MDLGLTPVRVTLLGPFGIKLGERSAGPWPRPSAKRLCEIVMLRPDHRVGKEVAREMLFANLGTDASANALSKALSMARQALSPLGEIGTSLLETDRENIWVTGHVPLEIDYVTHEEAIRSALAKDPGPERDSALSAALLEDAVLLADEPYADWALEPREGLDLLRQKARLELARDRTRGHGCSEPAAVIDAWEACLGHEPASEEAAIALISAYAVQGRRKLVGGTFDRCREGLRDLGVAPSAALERAYQNACGATAERPAPWSVDDFEAASNLPTSLSSFVGREVEQADVYSLVRSSALVTIVGTGGSGKTRLALEVARLLASDAGRAYFVDLAAVSEPAHVPAAVASAVGVAEQPGRSPLEVLVESLASRDALVVMDNCEHVIGLAAELAEKLSRFCPKLRLLATSREPLGVDGEHVYRLGPLTLPPEEASSVGELKGFDAVELFVQRAGSHDPTFALEETSAPLVASVCRRLDGTPLAIELAAACMTYMSLADIDDRLGQRFRLLNRGPRTALPHQRALQATMDWSFDLLSPPEQTVLMRVSVFSGGFELEAAESVCAAQGVPLEEVAPLLGLLVDKSLVVVGRSSGSVRYGLLETVRQYASQRLLASGGAAGLETARAAHAQFCLEFAERAEAGLLGLGQARWLRQTDLEWDNIRTALAYLLSEPGRTEEVLRIGAALAYFFWTRCQLFGFDAVRMALARSEAVSTAVRAKALCRIGDCLVFTLGWGSETERWAGRAMLEEGVELSQGLGDPALTAEALAALARVMESSGELAGARRLAHEAIKLGRRVGDQRLIGLALASLGVVTTARSEKRALWQESIGRLRDAGDLAMCSPITHALGVLELEEKHFEVAAALFADDVALSEESGSALNLYWSCGHLGEALLFQGRFEDALKWCRRALIGFHRLGHRRMAAFHLMNVACCASRLSNPKDAAELAGAGEAMDWLTKAMDWLTITPTDGEGRSNRFGKLAVLEEGLRLDNREHLRDLLGEQEFDSACSAGRRLSFDEAIDMAVRVTQ